MTHKYLFIFTSIFLLLNCGVSKLSKDLEKLHLDNLERKELLIKLIDKKNEILELLDFELISFIDIRRIQLKIKSMNSNARDINFGPLKTIKIEILSQLPRIENTIKVVKHYKIIDGKAILVPMDNDISLMRPKSGNNIYLTTESNNYRRVYKGCKVGPRVGEGFEYTFVKVKNKWELEKAQSIWIS
jgi:hypothetical protein